MKLLILLSVLTSCLSSKLNSSFVNQGSTNGSFESPTIGGTNPGGQNPPNQPGSGISMYDLDKSSLSQCADYSDALGLNDPLVCNQWHLIANSQKVKRLPSSSSEFPNRPKKDLNIGLVYQDYTGAGIKVHVTDSGLEGDHEDMSANFLLSGSRNYLTSSLADNLPVPTKAHGTMTSGLIAAVGNNNKGISGIAYNSKLSADNLISEGALGSSTKFYDAIIKDSTYDLWNGSFGIPIRIPETTIIVYSHQTLSNGTKEAYLEGANDNNMVYFKSNGNDGRTPGANGNMEYAASLYVVNAIAALSADNEVMDYSTPGANLVLSGYADVGGNASMGTCTLNLGDSYTCGFNGTSSAAPTVTGAAALVLEALKGRGFEVKWTDLVWTLIKTANRNVIDRGSSIYSSNYTIDGQAQMLSVTNAAGLVHSYDHGFGVVDVVKAVEEAHKRDSSIGLPISKEYTTTGTISIDQKKCVTQEVEVNDDLQIWSGELSISQTGIDQEELAIFVTMPDDEKFMVKTVRASSYPEARHPNSSHSQKYGLRAPMGTNAKGTWKVKVCARNDSGNLFSTRLKFYGFDDLETLK